MSLDVLARLRSGGECPCRVLITTDEYTAESYALHAGFWPIRVEYGQNYDFSALAGLPVVLALERIQGDGPYQLSKDLQASGCELTVFDLSTNSETCVVYR
jgi:hypothetical protein